MLYFKYQGFMRYDFTCQIIDFTCKDFHLIDLHVNVKINLLFLFF